MEISLLPAQSIDKAIRSLIGSIPELGEAFGEAFDPIIRSSDPKFGDYQANGILPLAKKSGRNPRALAEILVPYLEASDTIASSIENITIAGPGFINFTLKKSYMQAWLAHFSSGKAFKDSTEDWLGQQSTVIDFPSANTAKQAHIGHLRPMVIGEAIARILEFCGAQTVRDNHIGDWGTNFGTLIMMIKKEKLELGDYKDPEEALIELDRLYKEGSNLEKEDPTLRDISRNELVRLQQEDPTNLALWEAIIKISNQAFEHLFKQLNVRTDVTLGESFYRDKVDRIYKELEATKIAEMSEGALVVWHDEVKKFSRENERPFPFNIRKKDGASNYASTDLATLLYRVEHFKAESVIYLTDARQKDHFEQLFLTSKKWFEAKQYTLPELKHIWWGTILGTDNKPIKTKSGESIKLQSLLNEAVDRALKVVSEKNPNLSKDEQMKIAQAIGIGALKYADLSSNRTQDYMFDWDRMLSFEGNTAPYLLYVIARINSIFKKAGCEDTLDDLSKASDLETTLEIDLTRKIIQFPLALEQALSDLRPHFLCTYLFELASTFNGFYNKEKVIDPDPAIQGRRLLLCHRTQLILKTGLGILGIETVQRM
jgi:arginyl-tRNA synthetase